MAPEESWGTLKSTRMRTRLPVKSMSLTVFLLRDMVDIGFWLGVDGVGGYLCGCND